MPKIIFALSTSQLFIKIIKINLDRYIREMFISVASKPEYYAARLVAAEMKQNHFISALDVSLKNVYMV